MVIELDRVSVNYRSFIKAVKGISVNISDKVITGILGPNGAGKTSLLKAIAKIVKFEGAIYIDGISTKTLSYKALSKILSYSSDITIPEMITLTVEEVLSIARYPLGKYEVSDAFYKKVLQDLNITNLLKRRLNELSSGELRRVVLATAFVKKPKYVLLDEPDSHLDLKHKIILSRLLRKYKDVFTIIFTTHDILFALNTSDKVMILDRGRIVFYGYTRDLERYIHLLERVYSVRFRVVKINEANIGLIPVYR